MLIWVIEVMAIYQEAVEVHVCPKRKGRMKSSVRKWMKRRAAVEPTIGYLKWYHGMDRNLLKGTDGDMMNAILSACGLNFSKQLVQFFAFFYIWLQKKNSYNCTSHPIKQPLFCKFIQQPHDLLRV